MSQEFENFDFMADSSAQVPIADEGQFKFELLHNALDFANRALDEFETVTPEGLKYAVLHVSSAAELFFKYRLRDEHWSLVFADVDKADYDKFQAGEFQSVNFEKSIERLKGCCKVTVSEADCRILKNLRTLRNKLEHFGISDNINALKASAVRSLSVVMRFISAHVKSGTLSSIEEELLFKLQTRILQFDEYVATRLKEIDAKLKVAKLVVDCPSCGYHCWIVGPQGASICGVCDFTCLNSLESAKTYGASLVVDYEVSECFDCKKRSLVIPTSGEIYCFNCAVEKDRKNIHCCSQCGLPFHDKDNAAVSCSNCATLQSILQQ